jgi:hypothetical protein
MRGAIPPLSQYVFMAWCLVKHKDNFTCTFLKGLLMDTRTFWKVCIVMTVVFLSIFVALFHIISIRLL